MNLLTSKALTVRDAIGGWPTIAEAIAFRALFLAVYLLTDKVLPAALVAFGAMLVLAVVRLRTAPRKWARVVVPLAVVGLSAALVGGTGDAVNFYLPDIVPDLILGPVFLASMVIRFPVIGLLVGGARGERLEWRHDPARRALYQRCTAVFAAKFMIAAAIMLGLYLAGQVVALATVSMLATTPALAVCVYLCWRILRTL
jgi:hypothetical protein